MKLHAKDLMIGDWVCFDGDTEHTNPVQIDGISTEKACVDGDWYDIWEPIPITAEILEKNGWRKNDIFMIFNEDPNTELSWTNRCGACLYKNGYHICDCDYVHQLQHALRLVGIEKEIIL